MINQSQEYAKSAHKCVSTVKSDKKKVQKYGSMCHKLPILIRQAGLAQALSFLEARDTNDKPYTQLINDITETIEVKKLVKRSREADLKEYMYLTRRVLDAMVWYKRFAQSILDVEGAEGDDNVSTS